jgi:hypothetical protein
VRNGKLQNGQSAYDFTLVAGNAANELLVNPFVAIVENASVCAGKTKCWPLAGVILPI